MTFEDLSEQAGFQELISYVNKFMYTLHFFFSCSYLYDHCFFSFVDLEYEDRLVRLYLVQKKDLKNKINTGKLFKIDSYKTSTSLFLWNIIFFNHSSFSY